MVESGAKNNIFASIALSSCKKIAHNVLKNYKSFEFYKMRPLLLSHLLLVKERNCSKRNLSLQKKKRIISFFEEKKTKHIIEAIATVFFVGAATTF